MTQIQSLAGILVAKRALRIPIVQQEPKIMYLFVSVKNSLRFCDFKELVAEIFSCVNT